MPLESPGGRRRIIAVLIAFVTLVGLVIGYAAYVHRSNPNPAGLALTETSPGLAPDATPGAEPELRVVDGTLAPLGSTGDPEAFARLVARALFEWDTTLGVDVEDHTARLVAVADPLGESTPGLVADIGNYLPTPDAWLQLRGYSTRQWLSISSIEVPSLWAQALDEAGPDGLLPGTRAYTIQGVRHRAGIWEGEPVASEHDVAFTVFIVCAPTYPQCHLLRLSRLDEPLD
jgi:hypothetical protein